MSIRDTSVIMLCLAVAACSHDLAGPTAKPDLAKGGKPGTGTLIPFVKLANLKALGCSSAHPRDISSPLAASSAQVAGYASCSGKMRFWTWSQSSGVSALIAGSTAEGVLEGVGDNGTMVGRLISPTTSSAIYVSGGTVSPLALPSGPSGTYSGVRAVSANGHYAVGNFGDQVVLWTATLSGWSSPEVIGPGHGEGVSDDGRSVVGQRSGHAVLWTRTTGWTEAYLPEAVDGIRSEAGAINTAGNVITGTQILPLPAGYSSPSYDQHVVWTKSGSTWTQVPLPGFNIDEGAANDVADLPDGRTVVVGYTWDNTNGKGGTQWPVVWIRPAGGGSFGAPQKLAQISEQWGAYATAVNKFGQVVGDAWTGSVSTAVYPVMWQLPMP